MKILTLLVGAALSAGASCSLVDADCAGTDGSCDSAAAAAIATAFLPAAVTITAATTPTPDPLPVSGAQLWLLAGYGLTQSNSVVTTWADQSGNGFDAVAPGGGAVLKSNAVNSQPALTFDGLTTNYTLGSNYPFATAADGGMTIFIVARSDHTDNGTTHFVVDFGHHADENYNVRYSSNGGGSNEAGIGSPVNHGGSNLTFDVTATTADYVILTARYEFTVEQRMYLNGTSMANSSITLTELTATTVRANPVRANALGGPFSIGFQSKFQQAGRTFEGDLAEIILFSSALSQADREAIQCYLSNKYGITISHAC